MQGAPAFRREPALAPGRRPAAGSRLLAAPLKSPSYARLLAFLPRHRPLVDPLHRPWEMVIWKRKRKRRESRRTKAVGDGADELRRRWLDGERGAGGGRPSAGLAGKPRRPPRPDPEACGGSAARHHSGNDDPRGVAAEERIATAVPATPRAHRRRPPHASVAVVHTAQRSPSTERGRDRKRRQWAEETRK